LELEIYEVIMVEYSECPICLEEYNTRANKPVMLDVCSHTLCKQCAIDIVKGTFLTCPFCRMIASFTPDTCTFNIPLIEEVIRLKKALQDLQSADVTEVRYSRPIAEIRELSASYPGEGTLLEDIRYTSKYLSDVRKGFDSYPRRNP
jgi:hypothetical protein